MSDITAVAAVEEIVIDVSSAVSIGDGTQLISATLHEPSSGAPRGVLVCWPGGSYDRSYWQSCVAPGYSFAEHAARNGFAVVSADHLGVGRSSRPADVDAVTLEVMADAQAAFVEGVRDRFGTTRLIGVGHSLGGCQVLMAQAMHGVYDRVCSLGFTHGAKDAVTTGGDAGTDARAAAVEQAKAFFSDWDSGYAIAPRQPNHDWLYRPSTPPEVVAADDATVVRWPRQAYVEALLAGHTAQFAQKITCPLFLGFGDHDIPERPHDDVSFYTGARDITFFVLEDAAHCHNFAATRTVLWERIEAWASND
jgi:pimeloyl-ACP methyl ester carboxylesterase